MSRLQFLVRVALMALLTAPLFAQRIAVQPGQRPMGQRIVQVGPSAARLPAQAYAGVRQFRNWQYFSGPGPARARASYEAFAGRFQPSYRSFWVGGYAPIVGPQSQVFFRRW